MKKYLISIGLILGLYFLATGQNDSRVFAGELVSAKGGKSIPNARIKIQGATLIRGESDREGRFSIDINKNDKIFVITHPKFKTVTIDLGELKFAKVEVEPKSILPKKSGRILKAEKYERQYISINWNQPAIDYQKVEVGKFTISGSVMGEFPIESVDIKVNGKVDRDFSIVKSESNTRPFSKEIEIVSGRLYSIEIIATDKEDNQFSNVRHLSTNVKSKPEKRVALVIGNSAYNTSPLKNPINDARDMRVALREFGFTIYNHNGRVTDNLRYEDMKWAIRDFGKEIKDNYDVALVFYAGHGIEVGRTNYLLPIDARLNKKKDVNKECIPLDEITRVLKETGIRTNIVILDACRTSKFEEKPWRQFGRDGEDGGLVHTPATEGTIISYSAAEGEVASDNFNGRNGLFTKHLLTALKDYETSQKSISDLFQQVRTKVNTESEGAQTPFSYNGLMGEGFKFRKQ